ncbi:MAG: phosphonate C-P lyase system protein PhnH [Candidatus Competibacterales bacterium]
MVDEVEGNIRPGFEDPIYEAQRVYRLLTDAKAQPGTVVEVDPVPAVRPFNSATMALCLTLLDIDTKVWLDAASRHSAIVRHLNHHCGCEAADNPGLADYVIAVQPQDLPPLDTLASADPKRAQGDGELGRLLIVQVRRLGSGRIFALLRASGNTAVTLAVEGLDETLVEGLSQPPSARSRPMDIVLTQGNQFLVLPRDTWLQPLG